MSVFLDTNVYYAVQNDIDERHEAALTSLNTVLTGEFGQPYTSDYVLDEAVTLTLQRTGNHSEARTIARRIRGTDDFPDVYELLLVGIDTIRESVDVFERYADQSLSFTDAATVALVREREIDHVLSFDDDFDGLVDRLDPRTVAEHD